jgi:hypothetical protein
MRVASKPVRLSTRNMRLGEDILLARHGDKIVSLRLDRKSDSVVAVLSDGSTDSARNSLVDMRPRITASPVLSIGRLAGDFQADKLSIKRDEAKLIAKLGALWGGIALSLAGGILWMTYNSADPEMLQALLTAY